MIRMVGILSEGGVPVRIRSSVDANRELLLGALIEAARTLSAVVGSGEVRRLDFKDNTMIVTESTKGYKIVALVDMAEDYMESLLKTMAQALDESEMPPADGVVSDLHTTIVDDILRDFVREEIETSFPDMISSVWGPLLRSMERDSVLSPVLIDIRGILSRREDPSRWGKHSKRVGLTPREGLASALRGDFENACAACIHAADVSSRFLAIKAGALTHSMTITAFPPLLDLERMANELPQSHPLTNLAKTLVGILRGEVIRADYARAYRDAVSKFRFVDDEEHQMLGFMFLDPRITDFAEFADRMIAFYEGKSDVVCAYIRALQERSRIFDKLYTITSYDAFRPELASYKGDVSAVLETISKVSRIRLPRMISTSDESHEVEIIASLKLQNYITLLTALAESPVLTIKERIEILDEVQRLYRDYFRKLMKAGTPLFGSTVDSVFQSLSVALAEYYSIADARMREPHVQRMTEFVSDVLEIIREEWPKARLRLSLDVVANALLPVLARAEVVSDQALQLVYTSVQSADVPTIDALQFTRPNQYATNLGNMASALASVASRILTGESRLSVVRKCVFAGIEVQQWFMTHGVVCRDDIVSLSYGAASIAEHLGISDLKRVVRSITAINTIAIRDPVKYDYELAVMGPPVIQLLVTAWKRLNDDRYRRSAVEILDIASRAWTKSGFADRSSDLESRYAGLRPQSG